MSMFDWNGDGKKDFTDDFIEYQIYKKSTKNSDKENYSYSSDGNISTLGAIGCVVGGFVVTALLFSKVDLDNVSGIVLVIVWIIATAVIAAIISAFKQ